MDLRTTTRELDGKRKIVYCQLRGWDTKSPALYYALLQYLKNCCIFVDGSIAGGKTTFIEYIERQIASVPAYDSDGLNDVKIFPEPIDEVRTVTKLYYAKKCGLGDANEKITEICTRQWANSLSTYVGGTYIIERLPPPFRFWVFEKDFSTTYEIEREKTLGLIKDKLTMDNYLQSNHIDGTLTEYATVLSKFKTVMVVLVCPPISKILKQIASRGREEESGIMIGYMRYLASKFERAAWEIFDRSGDEMTLIEMASRFPL